MNSSYPFASFATETRPQRVRDVTWDRILFHPPELLNPRQVFDPLPFRAVTAPRRTRSRVSLAR